MKPAGKRVKGRRGEHEVVAVFRSWGVESKRMPLSGAVEGFEGDVMLNLPHGLPVAPLIEVKTGHGKHAFAYNNLGDNWALAFRADRKDWLVTLRLEDLAKVLGGK